MQGCCDSINSLLEVSQNQRICFSKGALHLTVWMLAPADSKCNPTVIGCWHKKYMPVAGICQMLWFPCKTVGPQRT
jgi:hypothetical protein